MRLSVAEHHRDALTELGRGKRFGHQRRPEPARFAQDPVLSLGGEDQDGQPRGAAVLAEVAQEVESRAVGKMQIEEQAVGPGCRAQRGARFVECAREAHAIAELLEIWAQDEPDVRFVIYHEEVPCGGRHRRTVRLEQASDGRAVPAEIEQEGTHVRRRLHQHDEECVGVQHRHDREAGAELEYGGGEVAPAARLAQLGHVLDGRGQEGGNALGIDAVPDARIDGQAVSAHHHYRVHAVRAAERLHYIADGRHTRGNVGFREVEVKQPLWVDPLERGPVSSPHSMRALTLLILAFAVGCGNPFPLPQASIENRVDTLSLYALHGTPVSTPSAYAMEFRQVVRTDQSQGFDFAFDIDTAGRAVLLPTGALKLGRQSGVQISTTPFDSILIAPTSKYQLDSAVVVDSNTVAILHSRSLTCAFAGLAGVFYAKLHVIRIDTTSTSTGRRMDFEILTDINCGYRGLEPGLPRR